MALRLVLPGELVSPQIKTKIFKGMLMALFHSEEKQKVVLRSILLEAVISLQMGEVPFKAL